jgi:hypothetical protein
LVRGARRGLAIPATNSSEPDDDQLLAPPFRRSTDHLPTNGHLPRRLPHRRPCEHDNSVPAFLRKEEPALPRSQQTPTAASDETRSSPCRCVRGRPRRARSFQGDSATRRHDGYRFLKKRRSDLGGLRFPGFVPRLNRQTGSTADRPTGGHPGAGYQPRRGRPSSSTTRSICAPMTRPAQRFDISRGAPARRVWVRWWKVTVAPPPARTHGPPAMPRVGQEPPAPDRRTGLHSSAANAANGPP